MISPVSHQKLGMVIVTEPEILMYEKNHTIPED